MEIVSVFDCFDLSKNTNAIKRRTSMRYTKKQHVYKHLYFMKL